MGKWDTVINDEFDGHLVVVEVRRSNDQPDIGQDGQPGVRVTITCLRDCDDEAGRAASGQTSMTTDDPAGALITLEPDTVDDLEGDLIEVGFSTEAAARISSKVSHPNEPWPATLN
jgi:hypothetical protein